MSSNRLAFEHHWMAVHAKLDFSNERVGVRLEPIDILRSGLGKEQLQEDIGGCPG